MPGGYPTSCGGPPAGPFGVEGRENPELGTPKQLTALEKLSNFLTVQAVYLNMRAELNAVLVGLSRPAMRKEGHLMNRAKRMVVGVIVLGMSIALTVAALAAECSTIIASTSGGATFPCTVCVEGGRPISAMCTPPNLQPSGGSFPCTVRVDGGRVVSGICTPTTGR